MNDGTYGGRQAEEARPQRTESSAVRLFPFPYRSYRSSFRHFAPSLVTLSPLLSPLVGSVLRSSPPGGADEWNE